MSDTDLNETAEGATDDLYADLPDFPTEDTEVPEVKVAEADSEGTAEQKTEETQTEAEGTETTTSEADESVPDLSGFPEEHHEAIKQYAHKQGEKRVSDLTSGWQKKLDESAEYRKTVENFEAAFQENPAAVISALQQRAEAMKPSEPEGPGEMPDPTMEPEAFAQWLSKRDEVLVQKATAAVSEKVAPALNVAYEAEQRRQQAKIKEDLKSDDDEFTEIWAEQARIKDNPSVGWQSLQELVRLRRENAALKGKRRAAAEEAIAGEEETTGLPQTRARRQAPKPTGVLAKDVIAELEAEGYEDPFK